MPVTATLSADRESIPLSKSLILRATLQGPAPVRVDAPAKLLSDESAPLWEIAAIGPATISTLPNGEQLWSQCYKVSPFAPGPAVPLSLREFTVTTGNAVSAESVAFLKQTIRVETKIKQIAADQAIPATGIEELPPLPPSASLPPGVYGFAIAVVLALVLGLFFARRRRKPTAELPPGECALRDLDALVPDATLPDRLAAILRTLVAQRFAIPAETMTTAELAKAHPNEELTAILEACDRSRFAGLTWDETAGMELAARARGWLVHDAIKHSGR